jgi:hypothetical protein
MKEILLNAIIKIKNVSQKTKKNQNTVQRMRRQATENI